MNYGPNGFGPKGFKVKPKGSNAPKRSFGVENVEIED
jgi:hypothetical protein